MGRLMIFAVVRLPDPGLDVRLSLGRCGNRLFFEPQSDKARTVRPEVIFFDAAGTLIRLARPVGQIYAETAAHYGAAISGLEAERGFRTAWKRMTLGAESEPFSKGWWREVVRLSLPVEAVAPPFPFDDFFEEVFEVFARPDLWRVFPEVEGILSRLRAEGIRRAVLSNWDRRLVRILEGLELAGYFEWIGVSAELGAAKPNPAIFRRAEAAVGVSGNRVWLLGDDAEADVAGAKRVGWVGKLVMRPDRNLTHALEELWSPAQA